MKGKKTGVPDRWLDYSPVGKRLEGTRFVAFKVPLNQVLTRQLPSSQVFGHWELLEALDQQNQELGLIIDLTFTTRYYRLQDVPESLLVVKNFTAGHHVPNDATILSFKRIVRKFLRDNGENDKLIGVHCTHGVNRTGYLICRYLIDVDGMDPDEAMQLFNSSRGHDIERQNYVQDLRLSPRRSNEGMDEPEQEPQRGQARQRPEDTSPERDQREWSGPSSHTWNHRSFSPRGPTHRRHHDDRFDSPSYPTPSFCPPSHPWTPPHPIRQRHPPQEQDRFRYPPKEQDRFRHPPHEQDRFRYPPREEGRSRNPPREEGRSRYSPREEGRYRYSPREEGRSRYPPQVDEWSRYPPQADKWPRYPPRAEDRSRYPPQGEEWSRYPPPEPGWGSASRMQHRRRGGPPPPSLPRYAPRWETGYNGGKGD
ncbi:unnamed protein product [Ophioblennius macclurei]